MTTSTRKPSRRIGVINKVVAKLTELANEGGNPITFDAMRSRLTNAIKNAGNRTPSDILTSIVEEPVRGQGVKASKTKAIDDIDAQIKALRAQKKALM